MGAPPRDLTPMSASTLVRTRKMELAEALGQMAPAVKGRLWLRRRPGLVVGRQREVRHVYCKGVMHVISGVHRCRGGSCIVVGLV